MTQSLITPAHVAEPLPTHGKLYRSDYHTPYVLGRPAREATQKFFEIAIEADMQECLIWPFSKDDDGYAKMRYGGASSVVSRLICEIVHGAAPDASCEAAHSCKSPSCINHRHISWKTPIENAADKIVHGTNQIGESNSCAKLTAASVRQLRSLANSKSQKALAKEFGIAASTVWAVIHRKKWSHVE